MNKKIDINTILNIYTYLNINDIGQMSEFWEFILMLIGLKPAVLFQAIELQKINNVIEKLDMEGLIEENKFSNLKFLLDDLKNKKYLRRTDYSVYTSFEWVKNVINDKNTDENNFLGKILGYECPGDFKKDTVTFVKITLIPSKYYMSLFKNNDNIEIITYACETSRINKVKKNIEKYSKLVNNFFNSLNLGNIKLKFEKRND